MGDGGTRPTLGRIRDARARLPQAGYEVEAALAAGVFVAESPLLASAFLSLFVSDLESLFVSVFVSEPLDEADDPDDSTEVSLTAAVVAVEAGALEDDADGVEDLAQPAGALRAAGQRVVGERLDLVEGVARTRCRRTGTWARDSSVLRRTGWHSAGPTANSTREAESAAP